MGKFQFLVEGWDDDPQELYSIPEVRKFYQHFHRVWPYWFFFCDLNAETLTMMTLCLLPNLSGYKRLGEPKAAVEYDPMDLIRFIERNFVPLNLMMARAGMSEMDIYNRTRDVFLHYLLDLPLDDGENPGDFDLGSLPFIEGDRPGSNLTYVEAHGLAAIASLQHRLNALQTGARIVMA